jgi:hypothetical protein
VDIVIAPAAEKFIRRMIRFGNVPDDGGFRRAVSPGGCSGLEAEFEVLSEPRAGDAVLEHNGLKVFLPREPAALGRRDDRLCRLADRVRFRLSRSEEQRFHVRHLLKRKRGAGEPRDAARREG